MKFLKELINEAKSKLNANQNVKEYDYEGDMAMSQLRSIIRNAQYMHDKLLTPTTNLPEWVQSKITLAEDYISTAVNYMSSEIDESYIEESADKGLAAKAKASGVSLSTLRTVYKRGVAAWNSGHRPGTTPQQWGMARVNSYITKGKGTYHGADKDLREADSRLNKEPYQKGMSRSTAAARVQHWQKADKLSDRDPKAYEPAPGDATAKTKPSKHTLKYRAMYGEENNVQEVCWKGYKQLGVKKKGNKMVPNCVPVKEDIPGVPANNIGSGNVKGFDPVLGQPMTKRIKPIGKMIDAMTNPKKKTKIDTQM
jgi:hypothetical protein